MVACIGAALIGRLYFDSQRAQIITQKSAELTAIRDLKIDQIEQWRAGLLADGKVVVNDPTVRDDVAAWTADPKNLAAAGALRAWMDGIVVNRGYSSGLLLAPGRSRWIATTDGSDPSPEDLTDAAPAFRSTEATLTDLFVDSRTGAPGLHVVAPLRGGGHTTLAVLLLHRDPSRFIYPLLQGWPTPSPTSETMLVRSDGDSVLYLNELRFRKGTALKMRLPKSRTTVVSVQALTGVPRVVEGIDYRGEAAFGAVGPVPGSPWFLVAKVDQGEAYAAVYQTQRLTLIGVGLFVLTIGLGLALAWRQRAAAFYRQNMETERAGRLLAQQYDYVTRYANDVVLLADAELRIVQVNDRATAVYGYTREELLAMTLPDLHDPESREETQANARIVKEQRSRLYEARHMRKDGTVLDMEVSARAIESGGRTVYLSILRDITERKRAEEELRIRTEELVRSNSELEKFAYIASHDLQEPLRMVASYTQLLQKRYQGKLDSDADEFIGFAVDGANRMQALINELLAYSRVGTQGAPFAPTDLEGVLDSVLHVLEPAIAENGGDVTRDPMPTVSCDATQIGQVFQNLISNALKFRGDRSPRIHVGARKTDGEWMFSVRDNGIGVETEYFDRIFVIFQRLQSRADYPGTGMGLAICKRTIERHGGRIWVESQPEEGSTFYFTLRDDGEE